MTKVNKKYMSRQLLLGDCVNCLIHTTCITLLSPVYYTGDYKQIQVTCSSFPTIDQVTLLVNIMHVCARNEDMAHFLLTYTTYVIYHICVSAGQYLYPKFE